MGVVQALILRHCAMCLQGLIPPPETMKLCKGPCGRRAYCSEVCRRADFSVDGGGQGHERWCALEAGEEDIDWEVKMVSQGKGLGLFAKRDLPRGFRILVERALSVREVQAACRKPRIAAIPPANASANEKVLLNGLRQADGTRALALRSARANHACDPNARTVFVGGSSASVVMIAERDIAQGEEVCLCYTGYDGIDSTLSVDRHRKALLAAWRISCPEACKCRDSKHRHTIAKCRELDKLISSKAAEGDAKGALFAADLLVELQAHWGAAPSTDRLRTLFDAWQVSISRRECLPRAAEYMARSLEIAVMIGGEEWHETVRLREIMARPESHANYLAQDDAQENVVDAKEGVVVS